MRTSRRRTILTGALAVLGCADATSPAAGNAVVPPGCYTLTLGAWSGNHEAMNPPSRLWLLDSTGTSGLEHDQKIIREIGDPVPPSPYWMYWRRPHGDSLSLSFTGGFVGIQVLLFRHDSTWDGRAEAWHDIAPPVEATANATLKPIGCPAG